VSNALGISAVTAVLQFLLTSVYHSGSGLGGVAVSAVAPDIVQSRLGGTAAAQLLVNVFLHQVTPNAAWRNVDLPWLAADGSTRLSNPPLALDLHYLLTAYGSEDCEAEALLGLAVQFMHETPVLPRSQIQNVLSSLAAHPPPTGSSALFKLLRESGIADQIEMIKITPATLGREELAWLWTALKADYRPTFPFQVTVVLIQAQHALQSGLQVLQRTVQAQPGLLPPFAILTEAAPPNGQPAACLGDTVTVAGANLATATGVLLSNSRLRINQPLAPLSNTSSTSFQFTLPDPVLPAPQLNPGDLPAGLYALSAQVAQGPDVLSTNGVPLAIAPKIDPASLPTTLASGTAVKVTIACKPYLRVGQQASLLIGGQEAPADPITTPTNSPSFTFSILKPTGHPVPVRLRFDGIDSPSVDMTKSPPTFSGPLVQVT
jgi:hypothetical protein